MKTKDKNESFENYELSIRCLNCLRAADINNMNELLDYVHENGTKSLIKFRNFGKKSVQEVEEIVKDYYKV